MKLAIMQPYFFPYIGYISLIKYSDEFMLFDPVQFIHHGWIERNRILKPFNKNIKPVEGENWQYISIPLESHTRETLIKDIKINNKIDWKKKIISQLEAYKKRAPYYNQIIDLIKNALSIETQSIVDLNYYVLKKICEYLDINTKLTIFTKENLKIITPKAPDEWALNICLAKKEVTEYINPPGGMSFFDRSKYVKAGIHLKFLKHNLTPYIQKLGYFESGLSIIDILMFNPKDKVKEMLDDYEIIEQ